MQSNNIADLPGRAPEKDLAELSAYLRPAWLAEDLSDWLNSIGVRRKLPNSEETEIELG